MSTSSNSSTSKNLVKNDSSKSSDTVEDRDEFGIRFGSADVMTLFGEEDVPIVLEDKDDVEIMTSEEAPPTVTLPKSMEESPDDTPSNMYDTVFDCSSSLDTHVHSVDSEMNEALERIENNLTPPSTTTSDSEIIKGLEISTSQNHSTSTKVDDLRTPSAKLPLGLFFSGKLKKRSRNRSIFRSVTHVVSWKVRTFRLVVQSEFRLILEYAPPLGDRKYSKETRKWEQIVLTPDMHIALAKDCKLKPQILKILGDIKAKSPMDSASPESRLAFQIRQPSKIDGGIILECETTDKKVFNGWIKALGLALLSLRESFASTRNHKRRSRLTSSSCPTLRSGTFQKNDKNNDNNNNDDDDDEDDDDLKGRTSPRHFTASMAVKTINSKDWGHSKSFPSSVMNVQVRGSLSKNSTSDDGDNVEWSGLLDTATSTSTTSGRKHKGNVKRSLSIRPPIELKDGGAVYLTTTPDQGSTSKHRIVSDVIMKDLVPYSASPDSKDRPMELGKGASGGAHLFRNRKSPDILYAVKSVGLFGKANRNQVLHELEALAETGSSDEGERSMTPSERQKVSDEHCVVHLHGHSIDKNEIQLILEYMNLGGLDRLVKTGCKVPEKVVAGMMWQVFEALKYMKNVKNMMHRDIKPANILWCTNGRVKVGDFGISRKMSDDNQAHTFLGTHLYMSPERYEPPYSYPADIYSTAIVMCELVSAIHPLIGRGVHVHEIHSLLDSSRSDRVMADGQMQLKIFDAIRKDSIDLPMLKSASKELQDLMKMTLMRDPSFRPSSGKILSHPWFRVHDIDSLKKAVDVVRRFAKSNSRYLNMENEMLKQVQSEKSRLSFALKSGDISADEMSDKLRKYAIYQTSRIRNAGLCPVGLLHDAMKKAEGENSIREL